MTGPEHYAEAERYLEKADAGGSFHGDEIWAHIAQAHALLAQVALQVEASTLSTEHYRAWKHVIDPQEVKCDESI